MVNKQPEYDVALSFAGEDRSFVEAYANELSRHGVSVYYDKFEIVATWGTDLYSHFDEVFRKKARFAVLFVSEHYVTKAWTRLERVSAQARALFSSEPYILPVRMDDTDLPGLPPTIRYVNANEHTLEELVDFTLKKLGADSIQPPAPDVRVPRSPHEIKRLLLERADFWEYYLFAAILLQGKEALEGKWRDHTLHYAARTAERFADQQGALAFIRHMTDEARAIVQNVGRLLGPALNERAFGPPGQPGDAELIEHIARRVISGYDELLDWSARLRSVGRPEALNRLFELMAAFADLPLQQIRDFIDDVVQQFEGIPELVASEGSRPIELTIVLTVSIDEGVQRRLHKEIKRLRRRGVR